MSETSLRAGSLKVIVFDIDGTLYRQGPLRRAMLIRLLAAHVSRPVQGWRTLRALRAYRRAQEHLRGEVCDDIAAAQIAFACERTNIDRDSVVRCVDRWMEQEPLVLLRRCVRPGLPEFLTACRAAGLRLGTLSDYPAEDKLRALGVFGLFDVVLSAQSPEVGVFKPHPRGLLAVVHRLGATPAESLYIGDRVDVDARAAQAAGIRCVILTRRPPPAVGGYTAVSGYPQLQELLWP